MNKSTKKSRLCWSLFWTLVLGSMMGSMIWHQNAVAQEPKSPSALIEELGELYQRNRKYCSVYKVVVDNNTYIMTTCGGIVLVPEG